MVDASTDNVYRVPAEDFLERIMAGFSNSNVPVSTSKIPYFGASNTLLMANPDDFAEGLFGGVSEFSTTTSTEYQYQFKFSGAYRLKC